MGNSKRILIVENDKNIVRELNLHLKDAGYILQAAQNGKSAMKEFLEFNPDLILLEVNMPDVNGVKLLQCIKRKKDVPVIILTRKNDVFHKVVTLEVGADDYMIKPFEYKELLARISAVFRRYPSENINNNSIIKVGDVSLNPLLHAVTLNKKNIKMTKKEFELFYILVKNRNKVITKTQIIYSIWGNKYIGKPNIIDSNIDHIKKKIMINKNTYNIENIYDVGYRFFCKDDTVNY